MDKTIAMFCLCALIVISTIPSVIFAASFDCSKASTKTEKAICDDPILSKLDEDMAVAYSKALKTSDPDVLKKEQRKWLKETLAPCLDDKDCIKNAYESRISQLYAISASDNITGTYVYDIDRKRDAGCTLSVQKLSDDKIKFALDCCRGAPSYTLGYLSDVITLKGGIAVYEEEKPSDCKVTFKFLKNTVIVSQPGKDCGWRENVQANGVYKLKSREIPKFEKPDYMR